MQSFTTAMLVVVLVAACCIASVSSTELLVGGTCTADAPLPAAWVKTSGSKWACCTSCPEAGDPPVIYPGLCSGPACTDATPNPLLHELVQVVDLAGYSDAIASSSIAFVLSGKLRTYCGIDAAVLALSFVDASGTVLSVEKTCRYQDTAWGTSVMVVSPPQDTTAAWAHLLGEARGGNDADGYFDDLSFTACTPFVDCPQPQQLVCPTMATAVSSGAALDDLLGACPGLFALSVAAGVEFPVVRRTGYCTVECAQVFNAFESRLSGATEPDCAEYTLISAILGREMSIARRKCRSPVSNTYVPEDNAASPTHMLWSTFNAASIILTTIVVPFVVSL